MLGGAGALGHVFGSPRFELVGRNAVPAADGDERDGHLASVWVGPADGGSRGYRWVLEQGILNRRGIDICGSRG